MIRFSAAFLAFALVTSVHAQTFPAKPLKLVVPFGRAVPPTSSGASWRRAQAKRSGSRC